MFRLRKSLYRSRNGARTWNKLVLKILSECGLNEMNKAPCVSGGTSAVVLCFVDDLILSVADEDSLDSCIRNLGNVFKLGTLGNQNVS